MWQALQNMVLSCRQANRPFSEIYSGFLLPEKFLNKMKKCIRLLQPSTSKWYHLHSALPLPSGSRLESGNGLRSIISIRWYVFGRSGRAHGRNRERRYSECDFACIRDGRRMHTLEKRRGKNDITTSNITCHAVLAGSRWNICTIYITAFVINAYFNCLPVLFWGSG